MIIKLLVWIVAGLRLDRASASRRWSLSGRMIWFLLLRLWERQDSGALRLRWVWEAGRIQRLRHSTCWYCQDCWCSWQTSSKPPWRRSSVSAAPISAQQLPASISPSNHPHPELPNHQTQSTSPRSRKPDSQSTAPPPRQVLLLLNVLDGPSSASSHLLFAAVLVF